MNDGNPRKIPHVMRTVREWKSIYRRCQSLDWICRTKTRRQCPVCYEMFTPRKFGNKSYLRCCSPHCRHVYNRSLLLMRKWGLAK